MTPVRDFLIGVGESGASRSIAQIFSDRARRIARVIIDPHTFAPIDIRDHICFTMRWDICPRGWHTTRDGVMKRDDGRVRIRQIPLWSREPRLVVERLDGRSKSWKRVKRPSHTRYPHYYRLKSALNLAATVRKKT